jgi:hypothetical protein
MPALGKPLAGARHPLPARRPDCGRPSGPASPWVTAFLALRGWFSARRDRLARNVVVPCLLYYLLAVAMLSPLAHHDLPDSPANDCANHVSGIIEARNALLEGQFPIRVAPHACEGMRYPVFQYYGNFPYTAGALLYLVPSVSPYTAFKAVILIGLLVGSFFTFRCSWRISRSWAPSLLAGAVFCLAPYLLTDIHARFAYPEVVSFCLLPPLFYSCLRAFQTRRPSAVLGCALAWGLLALSHNVTYLYASALFATYFVSFLGWRRKALDRLVRLGVAHLLGFLLAAWYLLPQALTLSSLVISQLKDSVAQARALTPLSILLAPTMVRPFPSPPPYNMFGLQVGWPILAAVLLSAYYAWSPRRRRSVAGRWVRRLVLVFGVSFLVAWSPVNFWPLVPKPFHYVQFPYRLLMFTTLWGSTLVGYALKHLLPQGLRLPHFCFGVLLLGLAASPYLPSPRITEEVSVEGEISSPNMGRGGAEVIYRLAPDGPLHTARPLLDTAPPPQLLRVEETRPQTCLGRVTTFSRRGGRPCLAQLPVLYYPGLLRVRDGGRPVPQLSLNGLLTVPLGPGKHHIEVCFVGLRWANRASATAWYLVLAALAATAVVRPALRSLGRLRRARDSGRPVLGLR